MVILHFAGGSTQELRGPRYFRLDLIGAAFRGLDISASQAAQLDVIRQSLWAEEPGGGRLTEVIRILPGPVESAEVEVPTERRTTTVGTARPKQNERKLLD